MSEMVERVAKAIWQVREMRTFDPKYRRMQWDHIDEATGAKQAVIAEARAAIEAMREPTPDMMQQWDKSGENHTGFQPNCPMCGGHVEGWKIMIDAALK